MGIALGIALAALLAPALFWIGYRRGRLAGIAIGWEWAHNADMAVVQLEREVASQKARIDDLLRERNELLHTNRALACRKAAV